MERWEPDLEQTLSDPGSPHQLLPGGWMALFNSGKKTGILLKIVGWAAGGGRYQDGTVQVTPNMSTVTPRTCSSWSNLETEKYDFQSQIREIYTVKRWTPRASSAIYELVMLVGEPEYPEPTLVGPI